MQQQCNTALKCCTTPKIHTKNWTSRTSPENSDGRLPRARNNPWASSHSGPWDSTATGIGNKKLSCRREAARCFMFVCSQLQHTYSAVFLLPITADSDLLVHKILLWLGYPMVTNFRRYLHLFWRNSRTWQNTDRWTDTAWQHRLRLCIASRGKNVQCKSYEFRFIRGFYVFISIRNILKGNLQPKFKGASVWPNSTAVITGVIFTCPGRVGPVFRLDRGLTYFARIALRAWQHAMKPYICSESRLTEGRTLDTSLKLTTSIA